MPRFPNTVCSQCGRSFGPGDHGFSDCASHRRIAADRAKMRVVYTGASDEQVKWGSCSDPRPVLEEGHGYEVEDQEVHSWHTKIKLFGIRGWFNDASFSYVQDDE